MSDGKTVWSGSVDDAVGGAIEPFVSGTGGPASDASLNRRRDESIRSGPTLILWDLVGACNLRCPACAAGALAGMNPGGRTSRELFERILGKLHRELSCRQLHLYNWTEPLLHPRIVDYCRKAADLGYHLHLSSNLNRLNDPLGLMRAGINTLRISVSGFTQPVYERGHRGGDVERVKANMRRLRDARQRSESRTRIHVYYLKYRHNVEEVRQMRDLADELGFDFVADWAFYTPLERLLAYLEGGLSEGERRFADEALIPRVKAGVALMQPHRARPCDAVNQLVLNWRGDAALCCTVYREEDAVVGNYLELDWPRIQKMRFAHKMCRKCLHYGAHVLYTHYHDPALRDAMERKAEWELAQRPDGAGEAEAAALTCSGLCGRADGK